WLHANAYFTELGIKVRKVLTDNGSCYRSHAFKEALGDIEHRRTRPYRPQTNGKVERFHRTLADEWAYARLYRSDTERCEEFPRWLNTYNHHRGHTALGGQPPAAGVHGVDRPHPITGLAGGLRRGAGPPRQVLEQAGPTGPDARTADKSADPLEHVAQPLAALPDHSIEFFGIEPERTVLSHAGL